IFGEFMNRTSRELLDNNNESVIAHELFHHWFGDYVTAESWSNLTINESFATMGSQLWNEYKYGKDAADEERYDATQGYILSGSDKKDLVRFHYNDKEDVFDAVSYNKGAAILQMLRNHVGDSAFFKALNVFLTTNKFKAAEAHQLRLAFEEVTGKDLNWFWNQWYFGSGHPKLDITYSYDDAKKQALVIVKQTQPADNLFQLPVAIDVYNESKKTRHNVWVKNKVDTFSFASATRPDLINFDGDKILIAQKTENKTLDNYIHQYRYAGNYLDRREAIDAAGKKQEEIRGVEILTMALNDNYSGLRGYTINKLDLRKEGLKSAVEPILVEMAKKEKKSVVRAAALDKLGDYKKPIHAGLFKTALNDSSYSVAGSALQALGKVDSITAYNEAKRLSTIPAEGQLARSISSSMIKYGDESEGMVVLDNFEKMPLSQEKFQTLEPLSEYLKRVTSLETFKRGVDNITAFHAQIPEAYRGQVTPFIEGLLKGIQQAKADAGQKELADYVNGKLTKKGFIP
ncbi:MAG: M1 family aminopeptidase, partial [Chitinophagaceae bacterium]